MKRSVLRVFALALAMVLAFGGSALAWSCRFCRSYGSGSFCYECGMSYSPENGVKATLLEPIATRTGPGTKYSEPGTFLKAGDTVYVRTKVWDGTNRIWWVQVEFEYRGDMIRAYTGAKRLSVNLNLVPEEDGQHSCIVEQDADAFAGPYYMDFMPWSDTIYAGTEATLIEVEDGYAHIDCWNSWRGSWWRGWVPLDTLNCRIYYNYYGYYGPADNIQFGQGTSFDPNSQSDWCMIEATSANVRSGPGTAYGIVGYVKNYEWYEILDSRMGDTGKIWYQICVDNVYGWISSGITNRAD